MNMMASKHNSYLMSQSHYFEMMGVPSSLYELIFSDLGPNAVYENITSMRYLQ
jgi:hypothetical protein